MSVRIATLMGILLLPLLAVAAPAQAQTCTSPLRAVEATCATADVAAGWTLALADCLLYEQPIGSWGICFNSRFPILPLVAYARCYYQTAPQDWLTDCL